MAWFNPGLLGAAQGQKAVAHHDEDSLTMAVEAGRDCLAEGARADFLYLASTTLPYKERQNAAIVAAALFLPETARVADFGGSTRAGTSALLAALDAVSAAPGQSGLVVASDTRLGKMGGMAEILFGDGAAAVAVGQSDLIAECIATVSLTVDFPDHLRGDLDRFDRSWEDRWIQSEGYGRVLPEVLQALLAQSKVKLGDIAIFALACPPRVQAALAARARIPGDRLADTFAASVGDTGAALPLMMLVGALERANPGDLIALVGFGSGADALLFRATERLPSVRPFRRGMQGHLASRRDLGSYEKYAVFRRLVPLDVGIRGEANPPTALSVHFREREAILGLRGARCLACGTPQYPPQHVCVNPSCGAIDRMEPYSFARKKATVFTFTGDNLAFSLDPPAIYGLVDFEGGGRGLFDFTDCTLGDLRVGMTVEPTFRRKYLDEQRAVSGYFWKMRPARFTAPREA